jgi:CDGSH-type Zn-finger protein/uncharacterized Fe-S cluster protein YjdI
MSEKHIFEYQGAEIEVQWDERLCIHVGECGSAAGGLFVGGRDPWCIPDLGPAALVREVCERCPSGALTYRDKSGVAESPPPENTLSVSSNGPLYLHGDLAIAGAPADRPGLAVRAALCRCGASANKPFCDNSHAKLGFQDPGAVGERGPGVESRGGRLRVTPKPNGPLYLEGNLAIRAASGRLAWEGTQVWLCRCGQSGHKPFCDGSHKTAGFRSEPDPAGDPA